MLAQQDGPQMEMSVPNNVAIYSADHQALNFNDLQPGTTLQIRYHPLSVETIEIQVSPELK